MLTVITLATAVKDMVELADKIHASFEKVSDNLRNARILASEIKQIINELKDFCETHSATLENEKHLREALLEVIAKLRLFDSEIVPLIASSSPSPRLLKRVKGGFKAWRNSDRIDASIRELKKHVKKCQINFVMMSVARMQVKLTEVHGSTSEGLQVIKQVSDTLVAHNTVSFALQPPSASRKRLPAVSNQNIVAFALAPSSTSTPIWKTPSTMKGQTIWDAYLKGQIDCIANSLSDISTTGTHSIEPLEAYKNRPIVSYSPRQTCSDPESLHRRVVMQALKIRETLENTPISTSIQEGAWDLISLAAALQDMEMWEEAAKMGKWAVSLFRTLVNAHEAIYTPYLVQSLRNLSIYNEDVGNNDGALDAIEEALRISERLQTPTTPVEIRIQYGGVFSIYAQKLTSIKKDHKRAMKFAEQSVKLMEDINGIDFLPPSYEKVDGVVQVSRSFLTWLYQVSPSHQAIVEYFRALRVLSNCLMADDQQQESLNAKLRALSIFYDMRSPLAENMDVELAEILYELVSQECKLLLPADKVLEYAEGCVRIYRRHAELNPSMYSRHLCKALWEKGNALNTLSRDSDALEVWKEVANIAQQMIRDQAYYARALNKVSRTFRRLKRHEEAVSVRIQSVLTYEAINNTITASQANGHYSLCIDCQYARRFPEAVDAAKKAVNQYIFLDFFNPDKWTRHIGRAVSALASSLLSAGDYDAAFSKALESMRILEIHIKADPGCVQSYALSLDVIMRLATVVNDKRRAIHCMDDVRRHMRQLAIDFPEEASLALLQADLEYGYNLDSLNHVQEARNYMEELIAKWEAEEHPHVDKEVFTQLHIEALTLYAIILNSQGYTDLALVPIQKGIDIAKSISVTNPALASQTVNVMHTHALLLVKLGRYNEALVVAEGALKFNREIGMDNVSHLVDTLHAVGLAAGHTYAYDRVVEVSQESVDICKSADFINYCQTRPWAFCFLSYSLQQLSSGYASLGHLKLGLQYGQEAVNDMKALRADSRVTRANVEHYYGVANSQLGAMYLANNRIDEARMAFEETRAYLMETVKVRPVQSGNLISMLRRLGIIYCTEGRHNEGHAAAQEAKAYLDHLAEVFPGLLGLVHIHMRHELTTPSLQMLNRMKGTLSCNHQADLSF